MLNMTSAVDTVKYENRLVWRVVAIFLALYVLLDLSRKLLPLSQNIYIVLDFLVLFIYLIAFLGYLKRSVFSGRLTFILPVRDNILLFVFVLLLIVSLISASVLSSVGSPLLSSLGARTYLLALPVIFIGYSFATNFDNRLFLHGANRFLSSLFLFVCAVATLQFFANEMGISFLPALEHEIHSFYASKISLTSSVFVSSKKFARFIFFLFLVIWIIRKSMGQKTGSFELVFLFCMGISGSREGVVLAFLFLAWSYFKYSESWQIGRTKMSNRFKHFLLALSLIAVLIVLVLFVERIRFILATDDALNYVRRIAQFFPFIWIDWSNTTVWLGLGPGSYGQETKLIPGLRDELDGAVTGVFSGTVIVGESSLTFVDSGLTRIIVELGVFGLLTYSVFFIFVLSKTWRYLFQKGSCREFALSYLIICWVIYFLKGHQIIVDMFASLIFYFSLGMLLRSRRKADLSSIS